MKKILVSACLLGVACRYDQGEKTDSRLLGLMDDNILIPVCPEVLGGMPTPRLPCEIKDGRVVNELGQDFTREFQKGAEETLKLARLYQVDLAILKAKSPSCGCGKIYDGSFSKRLIKGNGITSQILLRENFKVISEEDL